MFPVRRQISPHAARLRREQTDVERRFWAAARNRQIDGFKFRRQMTIGRYVVDFACIEAMLVVELDGGQHDAARDAARQEWIERQGYAVLRFWNSDMVENEEGVLGSVLAVATDRLAAEKKTLTQPSPAKAGEG